MEYLSKVLIKEVNGGGQGDKVFYVENLPKSLLFRKEKKQIIDYTDEQNRQRYVPDFRLDEQGRKIPTGAFQDVLLAGIEKSQTGDDAYCFDMALNEGKDHLRAIDQYIQQTVPVYDRVAQRVPYAMQPGLLTSGPIPLSTIPCVVLPGVASPPAQAEQPQANAVVSSPTIKKPKRVMTEEHKAKLAASLKLARERKKTAKV